MGFFEAFEKRATFGISSRGRVVDYNHHGDYLSEKIHGDWGSTRDATTGEVFPLHKGHESIDSEFFNPYTRKIKITSEASGIPQKYKDRVGTEVKSMVHMDVPHGVDPRRIDQKKVFETIREHPVFGSHEFWDDNSGKTLSKEHQDHLNDLEHKIRDIMHNHPSEREYRIPFTRPSKQMAEASRARHSARASSLKKLKYRRIAGKTAIGLGAAAALGGAGYLLNKHFRDGFQKKAESYGRGLR